MRVSPVFLTFALLLALPRIGGATLGDVQPCLSEHVREAMVLNKERSPLYSKLSNGKSKNISDKLIWMERKMLLLTPFVDGMAVTYQEAGIPILCQDLISMSETPKFTPRNPDGKDSIHNYRRPDIKGISQTLLELYKAKAYLQMADYADKLVLELDQQPRYNCLVKHMLESIRRIATLTPVYAVKSKALNKVSSETLSRILLRSHIRVLKDSAEIDEAAAPLQADGLPIICQDVPSIPWPY